MHPIYGGLAGVQGSWLQGPRPLDPPTLPALRARASRARFFTKFTAVYTKRAAQLYHAVSIRARVYV
jgi:hypothetical protein